MARRARDDDDDDEPSPEAELEGGRMPFLAHLAELRDRVRNAAIAFVLAFVVCWYFAGDIFAWLREPLFNIWRQHTGGPPCLTAEELARSVDPHRFIDAMRCIPVGEDWGPPRLIYTGLTQPFWVDMSVGLWAGIFVASPLIFYQLWRFIAPGLYKRERRVTVAFAVFSAVFFAGGALFCFYGALPKLYDFFLSYNSRDLQSLPSIQEYLDITRDTMLAFGAIFELPLLIYFLAMVGLVTHRSLWKFSRYFIVLAFVIGAILTPGPDVVSQLMMATPMVALYYISIVLAWRVTVKRERRNAALAAERPDEDDDDEDEDDDDDDDEDDD